MKQWHSHDKWTRIALTSEARVAWRVLQRHRLKKRYSRRQLLCSLSLGSKRSEKGVGVVSWVSEDAVMRADGGIETF